MSYTVPGLKFPAKSIIILIKISQKIPTIAACNVLQCWPFPGSVLLSIQQTCMPTRTFDYIYTGYDTNDLMTRMLAYIL